jgi:hypothetical protein
LAVAAAAGLAVQTPGIPESLILAQAEAAAAVVEPEAQLLSVELADRRADM